MKNKKSLNKLSTELGRAVYLNEKFRQLSLQEQTYVMNTVFLELRYHWETLNLTTGSQSRPSS